MTEPVDLLDRYAGALLPVFGTPQLVLDHGSGARVTDVDGKEYLDLLGGIAVNALGHGHPALVAAIAAQAGRLVHVSNFYTTAPQIELAERLLALADAPTGSAVFFGNSGAEAIEGAIKVARRTGRPRLVAAEGAFHGRTTGAVALTAKAAYREPFEPLLPGVSFVPWGDVDALDAEVSSETAAVFLEPIQGEGGVNPAPAGYLEAARAITRERGALLVLDEIQTGVARTGTWFAWQAAGVRPDVMTLAKGLAGGVPIGAFVTFGAEVTALLGAGQHGSTFGGNPLSCAAGLAVLGAIEDEGLLAYAKAAGEHLVEAISALGDPRIAGVRGAGLLRAIALRDPLAAGAVTAGCEAGFLLNAVAPDVLRLAPPLVITLTDLDTFVTALPGLLDRAETLSTPKD